MIIVGIIGSPSQQGNTAQLVREALKGAKAYGAEVEEIHLLSYGLEFCKGCMKCLALGRCVINDRFEEIREKVQKADGIVFGSPTYGLEPSAIMKNFLDRIGLLAVYSSSLGGKYFVGISSAGAFGARGVAKKLVSLSNGCFQRGFISGTLGASVGWKTIADYPAYLESAERLGKKLAEDIACKRSYPLQHFLGRFINVAVRIVMKRNIESHKTAEMRAVYDSLVSRGLW